MAAGDSLVSVGTHDHRVGHHSDENRCALRGPASRDRLQPAQLRRLMPGSCVRLRCSRWRRLGMPHPFRVLDLCFAFVVHFAYLFCDHGITHDAQIYKLHADSTLSRDLNHGAVCNLRSEAVLGQDLSVGDIKDLFFI